MLSGRSPTYRRVFRPDHHQLYKRCISLDIRKEKGKELLKKLVARSDLLIERTSGRTWKSGASATMS